MTIHLYSSLRPLMMTEKLNQKSNVKTKK